MAAMFTVLFFLGVLRVPGLLAACGDSSDCVEHSQGVALEKPFQQSNVETARAINQFAVEFHHLLTADSPQSNIVYSPFSIAMAFGLLQAGAKGNALKEIKKVFHWESLKMGTDLSLSQLMRQLRRNEALQVANSVWIDKREKPSEPFRRRLRALFKSPLWHADFINLPGRVLQFVNEWVSNETHGMIKDLLPANSVDASTRMILVNAVHFKSAWMHAFSSKQTIRGKFKLGNGQNVFVPMMKNHGLYDHAFDDRRNCEILRIPYENEAYYMIIALPYSFNTLSQLENAIKEDTLDQWISTLRRDKVTLKLPKFKMTYESRLQPILQSMGMKTVFTPMADYSEVSTIPGIFVDRVIHKAAIAVNEKGTEAAAATAILKGRSFVPAFNANRPFLFYITESKTGAILFAGRVTDPSKLQ